jgi:hypothetical protein
MERIYPTIVLQQRNGGRQALIAASPLVYGFASIPTP